jgi:hypothetical protein
MKPMLQKYNVTVPVVKLSGPIFEFHGFTRVTPLVYQGIAKCR